jgi:membrane-bound ClpP family serine protease
LDAWIKIIVVMLMLSVLSISMTYFLVDPLFGLILMAIILTLMVLTVEPATGKAMAQVIIPLIIILFVFQIALSGWTINNQWWLIIIIGAILYMMFAIFTGGGGTMGGGLIDAKVSLKLFPFYGIAIFLAVLIDPTGRLPIYIMAGSIFMLMVIYFAFLRDYEKWPLYQYGNVYDVTAITDISPKGKVKAGAEIWWAKTAGPPIKAGETVTIIGMSGITMIVTKHEASYGTSDERTPTQ